MIRENNLFKFSIFIRIFWMFAILCSTLCCALLLRKIILKIEHNPVVMYQPDNAEHIRNVSM